jgi:hypothetical protein
MDLPGAMDIPDIMSVLGLHTIEDKPVHIQCVAAAHAMHFTPLWPFRLLSVPSYRHVLSSNLIPLCIRVARSAHSCTRVCL